MVATNINSGILLYGIWSADMQVCNPSKVRAEEIMSPSIRPESLASFSHTSSVHSIYDSNTRLNSESITSGPFVNYFNQGQNRFAALE